MNIEHINLEKKLVSLVSVIGRDPRSWKGWRSLHIDLSALEQENKQDTLIWARSILEASLKECDGEAFCSASLGVHVICKGLALDVLSEIGEQICDMALDESGIALTHHIYDLQEDAGEYIEDTLKQAGNSNVLMVDQAQPKSELSFDDTLYQTDRKIRNYHDYTKVLLVEDDPVTRWMVRNALKKNCTFATADTAHKAYSMYGTFQPDIVFLDIGLPDESGRNVLEWIMRNDPGACVVMFSSNDNLDNISNTLEDGASGFIPKPFLKEQLLHYIHAHETINV